MGLRVEDANRDLSEYESLLSMVVDLSKKAKLSYTDLPFVIDFLDKLYDDKNKKIAELEHRLSNCIEPKFKIGQIVWHCYKNCNAPVKTVIESIDIEVNKEFIDFTYYDVAGFGFDEIMLFTTEAEAKKHLEELKND